MDKIFYMNLALTLAKEAYNDNEIPIGCVIIDNNGAVIGKGRNMCNLKKNALYHAEIIAINEACNNAGDFRLCGCSMFVTVEPCPMCAGAIVMSRIDNVFFGAKNPKAGCAGSILNILQESRFNHRTTVTSDILSVECGAIMSDFFRNRIRK